MFAAVQVLTLVAITVGIAVNTLSMLPGCSRWHTGCETVLRASCYYSQNCAHTFQLQAMRLVILVLTLVAVSRAIVLSSLAMLLALNPLAPVKVTAVRVAHHLDR